MGGLCPTRRRGAGALEVTSSAPPLLVCTPMGTLGEARQTRSTRVHSDVAALDAVTAADPPHTRSRGGSTFRLRTATAFLLETLLR